MQKRVISLWFPRLASDRLLRVQPVDGPLALIHTHKNAQQIYCLNIQAEQQGLCKGMGLSDARAVCIDLQTKLADPIADAHFLTSLARWAMRYCPWVGFEENGLVLNVTGATHLFNPDQNTSQNDGEERMLQDICNRLHDAQIHVEAGLANNRAAAWALARFSNQANQANQAKRYIARTAPPENILHHIGFLPVAALRLESELVIALLRLGLRTINDIATMPRSTLTRRFGKELLLRLDQVLGDQSEPVEPTSLPPRFAARITLPDPIGLIDDVSAALQRLLVRVCDKLNQHEKGARSLLLTLHRVDQASHQIDIQLARPMRDVKRIAALFERGLDKVDAGFGIEQLHLLVTQIENLASIQISQPQHKSKNNQNDGLTDLITRLGNRVGFDNIIRVLPAHSHIPEKTFISASAAYSTPTQKNWPSSPPRPIKLFPPEIITTDNQHPPILFSWRSMKFVTAKATGPERIAPEWWLDDPNWRSGLRDYWHIQTNQGRRLWLFFTPQKPCWFVHGEFA